VATILMCLMTAQLMPSGPVSLFITSKNFLADEMGYAGYDKHMPRADTSLSSAGLSRREGRFLLEGRRFCGNIRFTQTSR
jgi:hypothetical protein